MNRYSEKELGVLREFINIATKQSAVVLSKLIDEGCDVTVKSVNLEPLVRLPELLGGAKNEIVGLYFKVHGGITGSVLLFFEKKTAEMIYRRVLKGVRLEEAESDKELEKSALKEIGNTLVNAYINAVAEMLDERIYISVPYYSSDQLGAVIDFILIEIAEIADYALLMETVLMSKEEKINGYFILFPDDGSLTKMLAKMGA